MEDVGGALDGELRSLLAAVRVARSAGAAPRFGPGALFDWCVRAGSHLLENGTLTAVGWRLARTFALVATDAPELVSPEVSAWVGSELLPALLNPAVTADVARRDLIYVLLRSLVCR
jgi:hypothetical protein